MHDEIQSTVQEQAKISDKERKRLESLRREIRQLLMDGGTEGPARLVPPGTGEDGQPRVAILHLYGSGRERAYQAGAIWRPVLKEVHGLFMRQFAPSALGRFKLDLGLRLMTLRLLPDLHAEVGALARAGGIGRHQALTVTIAGDTHISFGCSTIVAQPPLCGPGEFLFGRNLDFCGFGISDVAALLTVHHPEPGSEEIPTASLGWAGLWGIYTGWNAAGLSLGNMQVHNAPDDSPRGVGALLSGRMPTSWAYTTILRHCRTVEEALTLTEAIEPMSPTNLMLADAGGDAALIEWDVRRRQVRRAERGHLFATNSYVHPAMNPKPVECERKQMLERFFADHERQPECKRRPLNAWLMRELLHMVNQGDKTLHSVVFEPTARRVHIAASAPPSSGGPWFDLNWDVWQERH